MAPLWIFHIWMYILGEVARFELCQFSGAHSIRGWVPMTVISAPVILTSHPVLCNCFCCSATRRIKITGIGRMRQSSNPQHSIIYWRCVCVLLAVCVTACRYTSKDVLHPARFIPKPHPSTVSVWRICRRSRPPAAHWRWTGASAVVELCSATSHTHSLTICTLLDYSPQRPSLSSQS